MKTPLELTREFHKKFEIFTQETPTDIPDKVKTERIHVMSEEFKEVLEAIKSEPLENVAKELADLMCAVYGTVLAYGMADKWDHIFGEMIASNMSKLDESGNPIKRADGKILKGPNFKEANISLD